MAAKHIDLVKKSTPKQPEPVKQTTAPAAKEPVSTPPTPAPLNAPTEKPTISLGVAVLSVLAIVLIVGFVYYLSLLSS